MRAGLGAEKERGWVYAEGLGVGLKERGLGREGAETGWVPLVEDPYRTWMTRKMRTRTASAAP